MGLKQNMKGSGYMHRHGFAVSEEQEVLTHCLGRLVLLSTKCLRELARWASFKTCMCASEQGMNWATSWDPSYS